MWSGRWQNKVPACRCRCSSLCLRSIERSWDTTPRTGCSLRGHKYVMLWQTAGSWSIPQKWIQLVGCTHIQYVFSNIITGSVHLFVPPQRPRRSGFFLSFVLRLVGSFGTFARQQHLYLPVQLLSSLWLASARYSLNVWTDGSREVWR